MSRSIPITGSGSVQGYVQTLFGCTAHEAYSFLWSCTAFPMGLESEWKAIADRLHAESGGDLEACYAIVDREVTQFMNSLRAEDNPVINFLDAV